MSTLPIESMPPHAKPRMLVTTIDDRRGTGGMRLFIATEAMLFGLLFFSYYYMAGGQWVWPQEPPPKLKLAIPLLIILLCSSGVLHWGETRVKKGERGRGRAALARAIGLGLAFVALQVLEYRDRLTTLTPQTNAYGSLFYTITSVHALHVLLGLSMLIYVLILPWLGPAERPPHRVSSRRGCGGRAHRRGHGQRATPGSGT